MRRQLLLSALVLVLALLAGVAVAGFPHSSSPLKLRTSSTTQPAATVPTSTTTAPTTSPPPLPSSSDGTSTTSTGNS